MKSDLELFCAFQFEARLIQELMDERLYNYAAGRECMENRGEQRFYRFLPDLVSVSWVGIEKVYVLLLHLR